MVFACLTGNPDRRNVILGQHVWLFALTIAPGLLFGGLLSAWIARRLALRSAGGGAAALVWASTLLVLGLGGFIDGIVLTRSCRCTR